jgi:hypothetical protein
MPCRFASTSASSASLSWGGSGDGCVRRLAVCRFKHRRQLGANGEAYLAKPLLADVRVQPLQNRSLVEGEFLHPCVALDGDPQRVGVYAQWTGDLREMYANYRVPVHQGAVGAQLPVQPQPFEQALEGVACRLRLTHGGSPSRCGFRTARRRAGSLRRTRSGRCM